MLRSLMIRDMLLIDRLELDFQPSLAALGGAGLAAMLTIVIFGWLGVRGLLGQTVIEGIREAG